MTELRLLGPVEVVDDGRVDIGGARPARLLVALYVADRHRLDLDALVERCFGDDERPDDPVPAIRTAVRRLRRALGDDAVQTVPSGYELDMSVLDVDVDRFDELIAAGRAASDPVAAITSFRRALDLWRGRPFGELGDLDWLAPERIRLEEAHLVALEGWHESHLRNGTATEIIPSLEAATVEHPLRERFHRQLMHALYVADRQADALRAFQTYREAMAEAGLEPGPETVALEQRIATGDPALRPATEGRPLRGYRIVERLGEGAFSIVYRGTQPSVDRDVAIKQIRAELANRPDFIRRFEAEAHIVAHLEHPFIVPLHDYWREPGSAYLVMRLLPGGSLESSLLDGPWTVERTQRMVEQIGAALSSAHRAGVVHRDVKPANILLDDEGNSYLTDFGIALENAESVDPESSLSAGSPAYASPEQLRREPVGPPADVHGLAVAVYEALTGRLPFPDEPNQAALLQRQLNDPIPAVRASRTDIPAAVDDVLQRATAKRAADRYQSIADFVEAFALAVDASAVPSTPLGTTTVVPTEERNPYKGLRAFDEADAGDFAGRDRLVDQLVAAVDRSRFVAVVGPSGAGKSSAVRAGLLPALRGGAVAGSERWYVTTLMPSAHPDEELEAALLRVAADHPPGLLEVIRDGDRGISRALRRVLPEHGELLLVIDQFEELFTLCDDEAERRRFLDGLAAAVTEERSRLRVVLTLRADFYDRPLRYESIGRLVRDATVPVLPLAADELERAIADPAHGVGAEFEPGLVPEIIADVADQPGALPLLQYALTELYEQRISNLLTRDAYRSIGGVTGALATRAEELFAASTDEEQAELRRVLTRLVTFGEGREDTRRRVDLAEIDGLVTDDAIIERFGRARLLSFDRNPITREPTVEIAHEALLREWPRLRSWLDDDRDGLRIHRHLTDTSMSWVASGRDAGELYRGGRLEAAAAWSHDHGDDLNETEREFLAASVTLRADELAVEEEHAAQQRRSNRRLRVSVAVASLVAVVAAAAGVVALQQRSRADDNAAEAEARASEAESSARVADQARSDAERAAELNENLADALAEEAAQSVAAESEALRQRDIAEEARSAADIRRMTAEAVNQLGSDEEISLLVALEAHRRSPSNLTLGALQQVLSSLPRGWLGSMTGRQTSYLRVARSDDGRVVAATGELGVDLFDVESRQLIGTFDAERVAAVDVAPDADAVAVATSAGEWFLLTVPDLDVIDQGVGAPVSMLEYSPDGSSVAFGYAGGDLAVLAAGEFTPLGAVDLAVYDMAWNQAGTLIAAGAGIAQPARVFDVGGSGQVGVDLMATGGLSDGSTAVAFLGDDVVVANGPAVRFDLSTGDEVARISDVDVRVTGLLHPVGPNSVIALSTAGPVDLVDFTTGTATRLPSLFGGVGSASVGDDGLLIVPSDDSVKIASLSGGRVLGTPVPLVYDTRKAASISDDGRVVVSGFQGEVAWSRPEEPPVELGRTEATYPRIVGNHLWLGTLQEDGSGLWELWNESEGTVANGTYPEILSTVGLSPSADLIVFPYGNEGTWLQVVDVATGDVVADLVEFLDVLPEEWTFVRKLISDIEFSPDGSRMIAATFGGAWGEWDTETWELVRPISVDADPIMDLDFSGDGRSVVSVSIFGQLAIRDTDLGVTVGPIAAHELVSNGGRAVAFTSDGRYVVTDGDGGAKMWDAATLEQIGGAFPSEAPLQAAELAQDADVLATIIGEEVVVWNVDVDSWFEVGCRAVGRNMTQAEWKQFGPLEQPYEATCAAVVS